MSVSETDIHDIGDIADWVEQRRQYEYDTSLDRWKVMRTLATIVVNLVSKKPVKENELFKLGDEINDTKRTPDQMDKINDVFSKWDLDEQKHRNG